MALNKQINLTDFETDFKYQDKFYEKINEILAPYLMRRSTFSEDTKQATDFVVKQVSIAGRIRRLDVKYSNYLNELTIRSARPSGVETELSKILRGNGDWFLYGYGAEVDGMFHIPRYTLLDLTVFRKLYKSGEIKPKTTKSNFDGSSDFIVIDIEQLKEGIIAQFDDEKFIDQCLFGGVGKYKGCLPKENNMPQQVMQSGIVDADISNTDIINFVNLLLQSEAGIDIVVRPANDKNGKKYLKIAARKSKKNSRDK